MHKINPKVLCPNFGVHFTSAGDFYIGESLAPFFVRYSKSFISANNLMTDLRLSLQQGQGVLYSLDSFYYIFVACCV